MIYSLFFLPEVEEDAIAGYAWYENKAKGLGEEFLRLFYAFASEIKRHPLLYPKVYKHFRRRLLKRFPYAIYFKIERHNIVIYGLFHCARNPLSLEKELAGRPKRT
jgi:hypothetical protein